MNTITRLGLFILSLSLVSISLFYSSQARPLSTQRKLSAEQLSRAKQLFKDKCARCHGVDGRGKTTLGEMFDAPDFTDKSWWKAGISDSRMTESIVKGKGGMPKLGKKLTAQQTALLVSYVRRFNSGQ